MRIRSFILPLVLAAIPVGISTAKAADNDLEAVRPSTSTSTNNSTSERHGFGHGKYYGGYKYYPPYTFGACFSYNRDGATCSDVGYYEGQVGVPWGFGGVFQCVNGCLQWLRPSE